MTNNESISELQPGKLLIVADDFTGASDTGVQFSKNHLKTIVITRTDYISESLKKYDVLVINTESRFDDQGTAYRKAYNVGQTVSAEKIKYFYKKLDSTMRGNIGAEISGLMDALEIQHTFVVPALPKYGRTTVNGKVYIDGVLLEETEFAKDPKNPVKESFIPKIISRQTDKKTAVIIYDYIHSGRQTLVDKLQHHLDAGVQIIVFDAKEEKDIDLIASVISEIKMKILYAGCSGLAEYLSKYLGIKKVKKSSIVIAGSVSAVTRRQIDFAVHYLPVKVVDIETGKIFSIERDQEKNRILELVKESVSRDEDLIIRSAPSRDAVSKSFETGEEYGLDRFKVSETIAFFLGEIASDIIQNISIKGILLTGGDTAIKTAQSLNISGVILQDEIVHGIPYGYFAEQEYQEIIIVSKAGGFGNEDAIFRVLNFLKHA
jgi:D-threonate/D-erythronate kinase